MIQKLVSLYEKHSLHPTLAGTDICLRFAETHKVNVVVRYVESCHPQEMAQVEKHYKKLRQLGKRVGCTQFRLVAPNGFTSECYDQYRYTVALGDSRYVSSLENDVHIELFAHNENTYAKMIDEFQREGRVAVVQATGTGKSLLIARWIAEHPKQKILVLAPSHYIVDEIKKHLPQTLCEQVCWMTYMRLARMTPQEREAIEADFVALDEFHRCGAIEWGAGVYQLLEHLPKAKVLGTSATPIRYLDEGRDMAEELFGGSIVQNLSLAKALALNILPTPKYVTAIRLAASFE